MSSPRINKYFCRECHTKDVSQFSVKSFSLCRACKRILKGKKYFCKICYTDQLDKFTAGRYTTCKQCRYKPDLEQIKENIHKAVLNGKAIIKDGIVHPIPSVIGVPENFFSDSKDKSIQDRYNDARANIKNKKTDSSDSDSSEENGGYKIIAPPAPRDKMSLEIESEKRAIISLLPLENVAKSAPINTESVANEIEKYLCYNENVFGISFKAILENITQYNLQKDKLDEERDEEIQSLREEIARLKYVLNERN